MTEKQQLKSRIRATKRLQGTWWPANRRLQLVGLRINSNGVEAVAADSEQIQEALCEHWSPVYSEKQVDENRALRFLKFYRSKVQDVLSFDQVSLPDLQDCSEAIKRSKDSAPGRDGLPYSAYKALIDTSSEIIFNIISYLAAFPKSVEGSGLYKFLGEFNVQNVVFAPKGSERGDKVAPTRTPGNLRTIFLSNTDNKLVALATNRKIMPATLAVTPRNQRGFCPGRQFGINIVVLDTFMRVF